MKPFYTPVKLMKATEEICKIHKKKNNPQINMYSAVFREWISRLSDLKESSVKRTAMSLSDFEMYALIGYLPVNHYSVKMDNLFKIVEYRLNEEFCGFLFECWLGTYDNLIFNQFFSELQSEKYLSDLLEKYSMPKNIFFKVLLMDDIPLNIGKAIEKLDGAYRIEFSKILPPHGITKSRLYSDTISCRYIYCTGDLYRNTDKKYLLEQVIYYDDKHFRLFLINFLSALSLKELQGHIDLAKHCLNHIGEPDKLSYSKIIYDFPAPLEQKYVDWINCYQIYLHLGNDERGTFWRRYRYLSVRHYGGSDSVLLECKSHYIIEFLGKASGPYYIYDKEYFNRKVKIHMNKSNAKLRQYLYHETIYLYRNEHNGYWVPTAERLLNQKQIAMTI